MAYLRSAEEGVVLSLFIQPRSSRNGLVGVVEDELKVRLTSPPVDGAANDHCQKYFAKLLGLPRSQLNLIAGEKSRHKKLLIRDGEIGQIRWLLEKEMKGS